MNCLLLNNSYKTLIYFNINLNNHLFAGILIRCILWFLPVNLHKQFLSKLTLGTASWSLYCSNSQRNNYTRPYYLLRNIMTEFLVCFNWCNGEQPPPVGRCTTATLYQIWNFVFQLRGDCFHFPVVLISVGEVMQKLKSVLLNYVWTVCALPET